MKVQIKYLVFFRLFNFTELVKEDFYKMAGFC